MSGSGRDTSRIEHSRRSATVTGYRPRSTGTGAAVGRHPDGRRPTVHTLQAGKANQEILKELARLSIVPRLLARFSHPVAAPVALSPSNSLTSQVL